MQSIQVADAAEHVGPAQALGLGYPLDVLEQLFTIPRAAKISLARCDPSWANVLWANLSDVALRRVAVPRDGVGAWGLDIHAPRPEGWQGPGPRESSLRTSSTVRSLREHGPKKERSARLNV